MALPAATNFVWQDSPNPTPPYATWATAAHAIQDAGDAAQPGNTVLVTNGVYAPVSITNAITLLSVNGPAVTTIDGGGVNRCVSLGSNAALCGFTLTNGYAEIGAGVLCDSHIASVTNCTLTGNSATGLYSKGGGAYGGAFYNCTLTGNAANYGGGAYGGALHNCTLVGNVAAYTGGGACIGALNNCVVTRNSADTGGGAYSATLRNCVLMGNSAWGRGGGADQSTLYNCTLTGNSAVWEGGGAYGSIFYNCIVYFNDGDNYSGSIVQYSCTTPLAAGEGNLADDPLLASATRLSCSSPCIGRGSPAYTTGADIDGQPWDDPPCMGADQVRPESMTGPLSVTLSPSSARWWLGMPLGFRAHIEGVASSSAWDFGDGVVVSNSPYASHVWSDQGTYAVRLTAYNDIFPQGVTATAIVMLAEQVVFYVNQANPTPSWPYTSWESAANVIQDTVDVAHPGDTVLVTNGVYAPISIASAITLRSVNGPAETIIDGGGTNRCVWLGTNAVLSGFTLTNGFVAGSDGAGVWCDSSASVSNCLITGNSSTMECYEWWCCGGSGGGAYGGTFYNCTLTGNAASQGGGVYGGTLHRCTLTGNQARGLYADGGGASDSTLNNCTLTDNSAEYSGGGSSGCTLNSCTLKGNSARSGGGVNGGTLYNSTLTDNVAEWSGGGACWSALYSCTLTRNAAGSGGGVYVSTLYNCTLTANSAGTGGGAFASTLYNCTVTGNSAQQGGGVAGQYHLWEPAYCILQNCIVYGNTGFEGADYGAESYFSYSCTTPLPPGEGNIDADPAFVSTNGWSNLRLRPTSPCIDAGMDDLTALGGPDLRTSITNDLAGLPRPMDGNGDGITAFDMGAHEFNPYCFEPACQISPEGFRFTVKGEPGRSVRIDVSTDLIHWEPVATVPIPACGQTLIDPSATTEPHLFYRTVRLP